MTQPQLRTENQPPIPAPRPLHVCHVMSADLWAGAEVQMATAASYLAGRSDVRLTAVLFNEGWLAHELRRLAIDVAVIDEQRHDALEIVWFLTRFLRTHEVDLVHTHRYKDNVLGSAAAKLAGVGHVVRTVHGITEVLHGWNRARYAAYNMIDKAALWSCADRIVAVSHRTAETLAESGYRRSALTTIHNGVDVRSVRATRTAEAVRRSLGIDADALLLGTAGRLVPVKGHEYLIQAAAHILQAEPSARIVFIGCGPREHELRAMARTLGVDVACIFIDPAIDRRASVYDLMAALDVFVLPSLSEGVPMALLEAMTLGRPVVASAVGGVPEVVTNRVTGLLVEPRNGAALAVACLDLARNRPWAQMLGARGRRTVETGFSRERNGEALLNLYHEVTGGTTVQAAPIHLLARIRRKAARTIERLRAERLREQPDAVIARLASARTVLMVCHGNIIRSPFAARLMAQALADRRGVSIASAGLEAEAGRHSPLLALEAAAPRHIDLRDHTATRLTSGAVADADAIFVMDVEQLLAIRRAYPDAAPKSFLLTCLAKDAPLEISDPVDADAPVFQACYEDISRAVRPLVQALNGGSR